MIKWDYLTLRLNRNLSTKKKTVSGSISALISAVSKAGFYTPSVCNFWETNLKTINLAKLVNELP